MADSKIDGLSAATTAGDTDLAVLYQGGLTKKFTWANVKATLKTYFDTLYSSVAHVHTGVYEPADATILKDADIGVSVQAYDATILKDADIGSTVQPYNLNTTIQGNTFNGVNQLVQLDGTGKLPAIDGSLLTNLPSGGGTTSLLAEYVVGTTGVKSIDFSGLDINTHKSYRVEADIKPDGEGVLCTYVNNTLTDTDYYTQRVWGDATSVSASRYNSPWVGFVYSGEISNNTINIRLCGDKYTFSNNTNKRIGNAQDIQLFSGSCFANFTNITQLTFTLGGSIDFSIGSKIRIYRGDV